MSWLDKLLGHDPEDELRDGLDRAAETIRAGEAPSSTVPYRKREEFGRLRDRQPTIGGMPADRARGLEDYLNDELRGAVRRHGSFIISAEQGAAYHGGAWQPLPSEIADFIDPPR